MKSINWLQSYSNRLLYSLLTLIMVGFWTSCSDDAPQAQKPSEEAAGLTPSVTAGSYTVSFVGVTYDGTQSTWTYTVLKSDTVKGDGLSHMIFGLGSCATFQNVISASIDGAAYTDITGTEGNGTGCDVPTEANIVKFDNLADDLTNGLHTYSFTLNVAVDPKDQSVWVKGGKGQGCPEGTLIAGPGCYHVGGKVTTTDCHGSTPVVGATVQLDGTDLTATTNDQGEYQFEDLAGGTYTVTYNGHSTTVTVGPTSGTANIDQQFGCVSGKLTYTDCKVTDAPYVGIVVTLGSFSTTTDDNGNYSFSMVPFGDYTLSADGKEEPVTVSSTTTVTKNLSFDKKPAGGCIVNCSMSQGYYMAKPFDANYPNWGSVTIGGKVFTSTDLRARFGKKSTTSGEKALFQAATIILSKAKVGDGSGVGGNVLTALAVIEAWVASTSNPYGTAPKDVSNAAGFIGAWVANNHCAE